MESNKIIIKKYINPPVKIRHTIVPAIRPNISDWFIQFCNPLKKKVNG